MKKLSILALIALTCLGATAAQAGRLDRDLTAAPELLPPDLTALTESPNGVFEHMARSLAVALQDPEVRRALHEGVARKFDGDFDVLYRDLANLRLSDGTTVHHRLSDAAAVAYRWGASQTGRRLAGELVTTYTGALPRLQVAIPVHFEDWDVETFVPLVAYLPVDVDDMELHEVKAFDAAGRVHVLDPWTEPDIPVVVVGLNERTDDHGYLTYGLRSTSGALLPVEDPDGGGGGGGGGGTTTNPCTARTHSYGDRELLYQIKINNDHEPWTRGAPEIYATYGFAASTNVRGRYNMENVDDEGKWYTINGQLFYWQSYYGQTFVNAIYESDGGGTLTISVSIFGVTFKYTIEDGDDSLGYAPVSFADPQCGYYSTGDAEFKMRHLAP